MAQRAHAAEDAMIWLRPVQTADARTDNDRACNDQVVGWIGGQPCLPDTISWPQVGGNPAGFLAQINIATLMTTLPEELWRGYGPRTGWLRLFLAHDGTPIVIYSATSGNAVPPPTDIALRWQNTAETPRWDLKPGSTSDHIATAPGTSIPSGTVAFDLSHPGCQPIDAATARSLIAALHRVLDESTGFLDRLTAEHNMPRPTAPRPGANGIWGRVLRSKPMVEPPAQRQIANPGILISGAADIAAARGVLNRLDTTLQQAGTALPAAALALICAALGHVELPLFLTESAPDITSADPSASPIRIYQRNVPATRSAWAPRGTPRSRWAEEWREDLAQHARATTARAPATIPDAARVFWDADVAQLADAAICCTGAMHPTSDGELAVLLRLPTNQLMGWDWGAEALDICLPLPALAQGDFTQAVALWRDEADPAFTTARGKDPRPLNPA